MKFPEKEGLEYFICIYLPGFVIAIAFLSLATHEHWIEEILLGIEENTRAEAKAEAEQTSSQAGLKKLKELEEADYLKIINSGIVLAFYTFYFIASPFLFGSLADGFRHSCSRCLYKWFKLKLFEWRFPTKAGYMKWVVGANKDIFNENIYLRRVDKSYFLYHTYEFFGNVASSTIILSSIYIGHLIHTQTLTENITHPKFLMVAFLLILCLFSMNTFWKENETLCKDWDLYIDEDYP